MPKALTKDNVIIQIEDAEFPVNSSLVWRDCTVSEKVGDIWNGTSWDNPAGPTVTVEDIRTECRRRIRMNGHDLAAKKNTPPQASKDYVGGCITACETLEGTLPADYEDDSHWPAVV